jgi:cholesterol transport system auxiliary component
MNTGIMSKGAMMGGKVKRAISLAALLLLAGCISLTKKPPERLISLTPEVTAPAGAMGSGGLANAITVLDPDTDRRLDVQRVPVQVNASTVAYLKDATWAERPARQFRRLLAETIRAGGQRMVFEGNDIEVSGKVVLSGRLVDMGYDADSHAVVVRYDALIENGDGTVRSRRFEAVVPDVPAKVKKVSPALNKAANEVARQVAEWVG